MFTQTKEMSVEESEAINVADHEQLADHEYDFANTRRHRDSQFTKVSVLVCGTPTLETESFLKQLLNCELPDMGLEVVFVDQATDDQSQEAIRGVSAADDRLLHLVHSGCPGRGAMMRTAIEAMSGDVVIVLPPNAERGSLDFRRLLRPILDGNADAVFCSRFASVTATNKHPSSTRHDRFLTRWMNWLYGLQLTDVGQAKAIRADLLRDLWLQSNTETFDLELNARLSQWGARIQEVPADGEDTSVNQEGRPIVRLARSACAAYRYRFFDTRFTKHTGMYVLASMRKAKSYNRWLLDRVAAFLGARVAEAGAGIGNMSRLLTDRDHLLLVDHDPFYLQRLRERFRQYEHVDVLETDLTAPNFEQEWHGHQLDTIVCSNVLEHLGPHQEILDSFCNALDEHGHCIIVVPAEKRLYNGLDVSLGHHRRYHQHELRCLMERAGFEVVYTEQTCKLGAIAWWINGTLFRRRRITPFQAKTFDRLWPLAQHFDRFLPWPGMSLIMVGKKVP